MMKRHDRKIEFIPEQGSEAVDIEASLAAKAQVEVRDIAR